MVCVASQFLDLPIQFVVSLRVDVLGELEVPVEIPILLENI